MKRNVFLWQLGGFAFTSLFGTILHYLYEWSGQSPVIAAISGVNESTWEHMKLLFFPMFFFALFQSFFFKGYENFWCVKLAGTMLGLVSIPILYYLYNGVIGPSPAFVNIAIFYIAAAIGYIVEGKLFQKARKRAPKALCLGILWLVAILFVVFTFWTPHIPLFLDPLTKTYGIEKPL